MSGKKRQQPSLDRFLVKRPASELLVEHQRQREQHAEQEWTSHLEAAAKAYANSEYALALKHYLKLYKMLHSMDAASMPAGLKFDRIFYDAVMGMSKCYSKTKHLPIALRFANVLRFHFGHDPKAYMLCGKVLLLMKDIRGAVMAYKCGLERCQKENAPDEYAMMEGLWNKFSKALLEAPAHIQSQPTHYYPLSIDGDLLMQLPYEIVLLIMLQLDLKQVLAVSRVARSWRNFVLNEPVLLSKLVIRPPKYKKSTNSVEETSKPSLDTLEKWIRQSSRRLQHLEVDLSGIERAFTRSPHDSCTDMLVQHQCHRLTSLQWTAERFAIDGPIIKLLALSHIPNSHNGLHWRGLTSLSLCGPFMDSTNFVKFLFHMPQLRELSLQKVTQISDESAPDFRAITDFLRRRKKSFTLPPLEALSIQDCGTLDPVGITHFVLMFHHTLTKLELFGSLAPHQVPLEMLWRMANGLQLRELDFETQTSSRTMAVQPNDCLIKIAESGRLESFKARQWLYGTIDFGLLLMSDVHTIELYNCMGVDDEALACIAHFSARSIRRLVFVGCTRVSNVGFRSLARTQARLEHLWLEQLPGVSDTAVKLLCSNESVSANLKTLKLVCLPGFTSIGVTALYSLRKIESIDIVGCESVLKDSVTRLQSHLGANTRVHLSY